MTKAAAASGEAFDATFDANAQFPVNASGAELVDEERAAWYAARQKRLLADKVARLEERVGRQEAFLADAKAELASARTQLKES